MSGIALDIVSDTVLRPTWWIFKNTIYYIFYGSYYMIAGKPKTPEEKNEEYLRSVEKKLDDLTEIILALDPEKVQKIRDQQELRDLGFEKLDQLTPDQLDEADQLKKKIKLFNL